MTTKNSEKKSPSSSGQKFLSDVTTLRERVRHHIHMGAITPNYEHDREKVVQILNEALATELVCILRYKNHYFTATGMESHGVAEEFLEHAEDEEEHADSIAERILQLGGKPDFNPRGLMERSHAEYAEGSSLRELVEEDLLAERVAVESYREILRFLEDRDPTTTRMIEDILAVEEEHATDMKCLLSQLEAVPAKKAA